MLKYHFCHSYAIDFEHSEESEQRSVVDFKLSWASVFGANVQVMGHLSSLSKCLGAFVLGQISVGQMSLNQEKVGSTCSRYVLLSSLIFTFVIGDKFPNHSKQPF